MTDGPSSSAAKQRAPFGAWLAKWSRRLLIATAWAYPIALIVVVLLLRYVGEKWWITSLALFVPRYLYALPLPFITLGLVIARQWRLLRTQLAAAIIVIVPLMGFVFPWPVAGADGPKLRVLSFNVDSGQAGYDRLTAAIMTHQPDIVLVQEAAFGNDWAQKALAAHFPHVHGATQFIVASRFELLSVTDPDRLHYDGRERSPRFIRYSIKTPLGPIAFYNAHPISPRGVLNIYRLRAIPHELKTGRVLGADAEADVQENAGLRSLQVAELARLAAREKQPVIIAGDLNLPGLSWTLNEHLSRYQDGFRAAGWGFGYTFSGKYMLLRLDRVLASSELEFVGFEVGCRGLSDHLCVVADLQRR